jgi:pyruvate/oxaloacetate carboxyltransferase
MHQGIAGLITPAAATELVQAIKQRIRIPLDLHSITRAAWPA